MLLGLVLHAAQFYLDPNLLRRFAPWVTATAPAATDFTGMVSIWIHLWRMPVFFLLAGFLAQMMLERKGPASFLQDRAIRIFAVLVLFHIAIVLIVGRPWGTTAHLWFLWFLSLFCLAAPLTGRLVSGWVFGTPLRTLLIVIPVTCAGLLNRENIWHDLPARFWHPQWSALILYGTFFMIGQSLWKARDVLEHLRKPLVISGLLSVGLCGYLATGGLYYAEISEIVRQCLVALATLGWSFGLIGLVERLMTKAHPVVTWGVEMAYAVYLFHLYIVLYLSALTIQWGWHQHLALPLVSVLGFGISALCYLIFVRWTPLNWLLQGYAKSPLRWPWAERQLGWYHK